MRNDNNVQIELSLEEAAMLKELLKVETIYQISLELKKEQELPNKVAATFNIFELYRGVDNSLIEIKNIISTNERETPKENHPVRHLITVSSGTVRVWKVLCIDTPKLGLLPALDIKYKKLGPNLIEKLNACLENTELMLENDLKINILNIQGLA